MLVAYKHFDMMRVNRTTNIQSAMRVLSRMVKDIDSPTAKRIQSIADSVPDKKPDEARIGTASEKIKAVQTMQRLVRSLLGVLTPPISKEGGDYRVAEVA